ncbi:MAG: phospholipase D-like domain-containing protein, partial [Smithellaceae bacterium]|nr:phospholipase D-like domain-containing protein [Smithellaceae bacterium]
ERTTDIHFRIEGPAASQIEGAFIEDWSFVTAETLAPSSSLPEAAGNSLCRVISDGPDEGMGKLYMILSGIISSAQKSIRIMTPYFVPPREILAALQAATLRGVTVDIVLPEKNNLIFVHWATRNLLWELLTWGVNVYYQPPPFAHTKLIMVDDHYIQIGSANIDARSLRLNFELNVEIYDETLAKDLSDYFCEIKSRSKVVTLEEVDSRPFFERLRDSFAWLFSSYL